AAAATFSATYYVDGDFDGIQDLIVAPNSINESSGEENMWFYKNTGTNDAPVFQLENKRYLLDQMLDFGQGASPTFVDYNADGLLDIVVGNGRYIERGQDDDARLWLFENIGTSSAPAFELADSDYLQFSQFNGQAFNYAPTFGDMDNDGDMDLVVGSEYGTTFYAENLAGANAPFDFGDIIPNWQDIDPGQSTKPFVVDVNEDGKNDLLIGERNGNVNYYENIGTVTNPVFNSDVSVFPNNSNVGGIDTRVDQILTGYTAPVVIEIAGGRKILTGSESRDLLLYDFDRTTPLTDSFALEASTFGGIREGVITRPAAADINGDGKLDLLVGNARGGLSLYTTDLVVDSTTVSTQELGVVQMQLFPNPVQELLTVELANSSAEQAQVELYNLNGELVMSKRAIGERVQLAVGTLPKGVYCIKLQTERGVVLRKIVVQ
ncbi:MAG: T9SS type A sorting domain-containing protein, partial [Bacteroidota bacterium]